MHVVQQLIRSCAPTLLLLVALEHAGAQSTFIIGPEQVKATTADSERPATASSPPAAANSPAAATSSAAQPNAPAASDKRAENAEQLRIALRKLEAGGSADSDAAKAVAYHQSLEAVLAQQQVVDQQIKDLQTRKNDLDAEWKSPPAPPAKAGCSFLELDDLKDELATDRSRVSLIDDKLAAAKTAVDRAQRSSEDADTKARQAADALERGKDGPNGADLSAAGEEASHAARLASETLALRNREVAREQIAKEVQNLTVKIEQAKLARLSPLVVFSQTDYQAQLDEISKKEESATSSLTAVQQNLESAQIQIHEAQRQYDAETGDRSIATERLRAQQLAGERLADELASLNRKLQRLAQMRVAWNRRYQTATVYAAPTDKHAWHELKDWQRETEGILVEHASDLRNQIFSMRDQRGTLTSIMKKIDDAKTGPDGLLPSLEMQRNQVEAMLRTRERDMVTIETSRRVHEKLLEEIGTGVNALSAKAIALGAWDQAGRIWNFELGSIEDKSITIKTIVAGVAMFIGGWMLSRFLSALFAYRVLKRFRLSKDGTAAIRTLVFYTMLTIVALWSLKTVHLPLTAFSILGGGLAIGVGFGSQALINNFIGGLIMLAERPVRLGERINFGKYEGVVEDVGFRCTRLRTLTDHLVTIPNSMLVNESIENVARRRTIRRKLDIKLASETPREKIVAAVEAIRDILQEKEIRERIHPIVGFEELPPRVYFNDFDADGLNILVVYWYAPADGWGYTEHCERINLRIMEDFARLGIEFASSSHMVYLKSASPAVAESGLPTARPNNRATNYAA